MGGGASFNREVLPLDGGGGSPNPPHIGQPWLKKTECGITLYEKIYGSWVLGSLNRPMSQDCSMIESYSLSNSGSVVKFEVLFDIWLGGRVHSLG